MSFAGDGVGWDKIYGEMTPGEIKNPSFSPSTTAYTFQITELLFLLRHLHYPVEDFTCNHILI